MEEKTTTTTATTTTKPSNSSTTTRDDEYGCFAKIPRKIHIVDNLKNGDLWRISTVHSHEVVLLRNSQDARVMVAQNQRIAAIILLNCSGIKFQMLDSALLTTRTFRMINCRSCELLFEDVDVRKVECWNVQNIKIAYTQSPTIVSNVKIIWREDCMENEVLVTDMLEDSLNHLRVQAVVRESKRIPPSTHPQQFVTYFDEFQHIHNETLVTLSGVSHPEGVQLLCPLQPFLLRYLPSDSLDASFLPKVETILEDLERMEQTSYPFTDEEVRKALDGERREYEETEEAIKEKVKRVAQLIKESRRTIIYTGAGISTAADIPDFRGPEGVWTKKDRGEEMTEGKELDQTKPTYAHYAITELVRRHFVHFVITTNMDSLHLRTGLPNHLLVEQHGNCHKELCESCFLPHFRQFNVGTTVQDTRAHYTGRNCHFCNGRLKDSIVHFSESFRGMHDEVISVAEARKASLAIVMGTSMNVQPNATYPEMCFKNNINNNTGQLVIVNLQKTPYDDMACVRLFCRTDAFMKALMEELSIPEFDRQTDIRERWDTLSQADSCTLS